MENKRDSFFLANKKKENKADKPNKKNDNDAEKDKKKALKMKRIEQYDKFRGMKELERAKLKGEEKKPNSKEEEKKPFDKKAYRLMKYSKKYKLEQWEEQRKKKMLREYQKELKNDEVAGTYKAMSFDEDMTDGEAVGRFVRHPDLMEKENGNADTPKFTKKDPLQKAKDQIDKAKAEKLKLMQYRDQAKEEKKKKMMDYKKQKIERFKKLSQKTKKGQPVMTGRLEMLLEKIQKM